MLSKNAGIDSQIELFFEPDVCCHCSPKSCGIQVGRLEWCWARFLPPIDHLLPKKAHGHRCFWQRILAILTCLKFFFIPPRVVMQWFYKKQFPHCWYDRYGGQCFESKPESTPFGEPLKRSYLGAGGAQLDGQFQFHRIHIGKLDDPTTGKNKTHTSAYMDVPVRHIVRSFGDVFTCYISIVCPVIWISTGRFWKIVASWCSAANRRPLFLGGLRSGTRHVAWHAAEDTWRTWLIQAAKHLPPLNNPYLNKCDRWHQQISM